MCSISRSISISKITSNETDTYLILVANSLFLFGQDKPARQWILGGTVGYKQTNTTTYEPDDVFDNELKSAIKIASFRPYFGKTLSRRWQAGIFTGYRYGKERLLHYEDHKSSHSETHEGTIGLYARYVVNPDHKLTCLLRTFRSGQLLKLKLNKFL